MKLKPNWPAVKAAYLNREGSFRDLAERYGISFHSLAKRAKREGWADDMAKLGDAVATTVATTAMETATEQGKSIGMNAAQFVERSIEETARWLDRVERLANAGELDASELKTLLESWRIAIGIGRETFRLDDQPASQSLVQINLLADPSVMKPATPLPTEPVEGEPA